MKILITGCYGLIGSSLSNLLKKHYQIIGIDNFSSGNKNAKKITGINFFNGNVNDRNLLKKVFSLNIDIVIHAAANPGFNGSSIIDQAKEINTNIVSTVKILNLCAQYKIKQFIFLSSSCVYGNGKNKRNFKENSKITLDTPYAISKYSSEQYIKFYAKNFDIKFTIFRVFNTYGPGEFKKRFNNVIFNFSYNCLNQKKILLYTFKNKKNYRSFCYVDDISKGIMMSINNEKASNQIFNIGSNSPLEISYLAKKIITLSKSKSKIFQISQRRWDEVYFRAANIDKIEKYLNWKPRTSLNEGLSKTIKWLKKF